MNKIVNGLDVSASLTPAQVVALCELANDEAASVEVLDILGSSIDDDIRIAVASNSATSPCTLFTLASDEDDEVRVAVADNYSAPSAALAVLASDENDEVRLCVAGNLNTPETALVDLASDGWSDIRNTVSMNPSLTSVKTMVELQKEENVCRPEFDAVIATEIERLRMKHDLGGLPVSHIIRGFLR